MSSTILTSAKNVGHSLLVIETATEHYRVAMPIYASKAIDAATRVFAKQPENVLLGGYIEALSDLEATSETADPIVSVATTAILLRALHMRHGQPAALVISGVDKNGDLHLRCWTKSFDHLPKGKRIKAAREEIEQDIAMAEVA